jgi:hypothetical protein
MMEYSPQDSPVLWVDSFMDNIFLMKREGKSPTDFFGFCNNNERNRVYMYKGEKGEGKEQKNKELRQIC